ncbi:hypothetical protein AO239_06945 [Pseudomonas sp. ICMP 19500]|nr:hypothetical protein AO239_06945 [Pseudomonas sp. ICMP 19500]
MRRYNFDIPYIFPKNCYSSTKHTKLIKPTDQAMIKTLQEFNSVIFFLAYYYFFPGPIMNNNSIVKSLM